MLFMFSSFALIVFCSITNRKYTVPFLKHLV